MATKKLAGAPEVAAPLEPSAGELPAAKAPKRSKKKAKKAAKKATKKAARKAAKKKKAASTERKPSKKGAKKRGKAGKKQAAKKRGKAGKKQAAKKQAAKKPGKKTAKKTASVDASPRKKARGARKKRAAKKVQRAAKKVQRAAKKLAKAAKKIAKAARAVVGGDTAATAGGVEKGSTAPAFALPDQSGEIVRSESLAGRPYVLYFYPKDDTPGCTVEACGFRDEMADLESLGVQVLGVSPDSQKSHEKFRAKYSLGFPLLSDTDKEVAQAYGAWGLKKRYGREYMGIIRSTFLVDAEGTVRRAWRNVRVDGHVAAVKDAARDLA